MKTITKILCFPILKTKSEAMGIILKLLDKQKELTVKILLLSEAMATMAFEIESKTKHALAAS